MVDLTDLTDAEGPDAAGATAGPSNAAGDATAADAKPAGKAPAKKRARPAPADHHRESHDARTGHAACAGADEGNIGADGCCGATLVMCPLVAVTQWRQEIERYTNPGTLKVRRI